MDHGDREVLGDVVGEHAKREVGVIGHARGLGGGEAVRFEYEPRQGHDSLVPESGVRDRVVR